MIDIQNKKDKILLYLEENGPSLPVRIAKAIEMDPMFASAIASELISSDQIKPSNMKIGASFLYLIPGQEEQLVNFTDNLKSVEKTAFDKLKENKILTDEDEEPSTRVALRNIKDFAVPFKFQGKIMWKYAFISNEELEELLTKLNENIQEEDMESKIIKNDIEEETTEEEETREKENEPPQGTTEEQSSIDTFSEEEPEVVPKAWENKKEEIEQIRKESIEEKDKKIENIFTTEDNNEPEPEFLTNIKKFLKERNIEFLEEIKTEKKEIMAIVKITSQLGNINMLLVAKDKKTTNKDEIKGAIQMATNGNMSCLLIIRKEPTKPIQKIIDENHLVKLEVME
jgi:hypothetical protein